MNITSILNILVIFGITVLVGFTSTYADPLVQINASKCPDNLQVGEKGNVELSIINTGQKDLYITNIIPSQSLSREQSISFSVNDNMLPLHLGPSSIAYLDGKFSSTIEGISYLDLNVTYSDPMEKNNSNFFTYQEICKIKILSVGADQTPLWQNMLIGGGIISAVASFVIYFIKRPFVKKDFEQQQEAQHNIWLLQQMHQLAEQYYFPLSKFAEETRRTLAIANYSKNPPDIKIAYSHLREFLQKYMEFKKKTGANFLFKDGTKFEMRAIGKLQAILVSLPFDQDGIDEIGSDKLVYNPLKPSSYNKQYEYFEEWIKSENCVKSRSQVIQKLKEFWDVLEDQAERISQPDYLSQIHPPLDPIQEDNFWILYSSYKYISMKDAKIIVFGKGFDDEEIKYQFYITGYDDVLFKKDKWKITKTSEGIQLEILHYVKPGTYDLYAKYGLNGNLDKETIRLVIRVDK